MSCALFIVGNGFDYFEYFYARHRLGELVFPGRLLCLTVDAVLRLSMTRRKGELRPRPCRIRGKHVLEVEVDADYVSALKELDSFGVLVVPGGRGWTGPEGMGRPWR